MCIRDRRGAAPGIERDPAWAPDGTRIAFAASRGAGFDIFVASVKDGCLLYTSDAADERSSVDLGGRRIIKKKKTRERGLAV